MLLSEILLTIPYKIIWNIKKILKLKKNNIVFFCADYLDYVIFEEIHKLLPEINIVSKNKTIKAELEKHGVKSISWPVFPKTVIMARHSFQFFPESKIKKIGMRHGAYHFKKFIGAKKYNRFDLFLFTSETEVEQAKSIGINCGANGGFPKIDRMFANNEVKIQSLKKELNFDDKPTIMFSSTWDKSGMAAVEKWYDKLDLLTDKYNIIVTLHPWVSETYKNKIVKTKNIILIEEKKNYMYLELADVFIGDTSSIIAEFNALDKPIITFKIDNTNNRLTPEINDMLEDISIRIDSFDDLNIAIENSLKKPDEKSSSRIKYNKIMFDELDGKHSIRSAEIISKFLNKNE